MTAGSTGAPGPGAIVPRLVVDEVYDRLLGTIIDGRMRPDAVLGIDAIARELGVSSSPVREALARLEATGLVRRYALRGYRVAPPLDAEELAELMDARLLLEPAAAAIASRRLTPGLLEELRASVEALRTAPNGERFDAFRDYFEADRRFHRAIFAGTGNRFLALAYDALGGQVQRFRLFSGQGVTDAEPTVAEHAAVLAAIAEGDEEAAAAAMRAHLVGVRARVLVEAGRPG